MANEPNYSSNPSKDEPKKEKVRVIPLEYIDEFPGHPFKVLDDESKFNVYDDIRKKLIEEGIPESEIAFIHDADTDAKKKDLFSKVRSGQVRVRERCRCNYENRPRPVRAAFVYQKRECATGIMGLYRHYAYLLKHFPHEVRPFDRTAYAAMRDDARKMKRYSEEAKLLAANDIVTAEDLQHFTENVGTRFKALAYERAKQRNRLRRMHDSTAMQPTKEIIYDLTAQMAGLRRQMRLCEDIAERCGVIEMVVNEIERGQIAEKKKPAEKKNCEKGIDI